MFESKSEVASGCARGSNNVAENTPNMPTVFSPAERMLSVSEEWEHGTVKWKVYRAYCGAVGSVLTPLILLAILIMQGESLNVRILFQS